METYHEEREVDKRNRTNWRIRRIIKSVEGSKNE